MTKLEKADFIQKRLDALYPSLEIPLRHGDAFTLLVAVVLSAQCTDRRVNEVTPALFALASTPSEMAALPVERIREIIRPCGLSNAKAPNISNLSKIIAERFGGEVPADMEELESLPGVGHKTASVVMMQAFGVPTFPVDTHIHRLARRWGLSSGKSVEQTEKDMKKLFPKDSWPRLHLQLIHYGREHCRAHLCKTRETMCPMCLSLGAKPEKPGK